MPTSVEKYFEGESHRQRDMAESFGAQAERYDRARPRYPDALIEHIASLGTTVLDVGCGTGIAARQLAAAGCSVLGVDADARMIEVARASGLAAEVSRFEDWDPAGRSFEVVTSAQTWHWIDPVRGAGKAAQVLRPGGALTLFWNAPLPGPDVQQMFSRAHERAGVPAFWVAGAGEPYGPVLDAAADGLRRAGGFAEAGRSRYEWAHRYERQDWLDQLPTTGIAGRLPPGVMTRLIEETGAAIDEMGGAFDLPYVTVVLTAVLRRDDELPHPYVPDHEGEIRR